MWNLLLVFWVAAPSTVKALGVSSGFGKLDA
jgi:hypothetical protein